MWHKFNLLFIHPSRGQRWSIRLLILLIGLMVLLSKATSCRAELVDRIVAVVNNDIILASELDQALAPWMEKFKRQGYSEMQLRIFLADQRPKVLDQLITEKLTDQQVLLQHITLSDDEVDNTIKRIKEINKLSDQKFQRKLELDGISYDKFRAQIKEKLLRTKLVNREVKSKIVITDDDVRAYYDKHRDQYSGQTKYHLRQILMKTDSSTTQAERKRISQQMADILDRLQQGEGFEDLARVYSQAPTAKDGGDLGVFEEKLLTSQIKEALQGLKAGQFTPVIETEQGLQIFYVEEVSHARGKTWQDVKREIQEKLFANIVDHKFHKWLDQLRQQSHIKILK